MTVYGEMVVEDVTTRRSSIVAETIVHERVFVVENVAEHVADQFEDLSREWQAGGETYRQSVTYTFHPYAFED